MLRKGCKQILKHCMQHLRLFLQINDVEIQENNFIYQRNRNISHQNIKTKVKRCEHIHFDLRHKSEYVRVGPRGLNHGSVNISESSDLWSQFDPLNIFSITIWPVKHIFLPFFLNTLCRHMHLNEIVYNKQISIIIKNKLKDFWVIDQHTYLLWVMTY